MKIVDSFSLPAAFIRAVEHDDYDKGDSDASITELIGPAQAAEIIRQHADEITEEAVDRVWVLLGKVAHAILQQHAGRDALSEERLYMDVLGWRVSGQLDHFVLLPDETLQDYKITSVWAIKDGPKNEWTAQANCYAELLRRHGFHPKKLEIVAILRDWRASERKRYPEWYPEHPVKKLSMPLWEPSYTMTYLGARVQEHRVTRHGFPSVCTAEERWERPGVFAVYKGKNKRATRLFESREEAEVFQIEMAGKDSRIEQRPAIQARCQPDERGHAYCAASRWCSQFAALKPAEVVDDAE